MAPGAGAGAAAAAALWSNIGQPELNEAISKGTQIAAAAAMAPLESTWLGGGQMGAPTVGSPAQVGWTGKRATTAPRAGGGSRDDRRGGHRADPMPP